MIEGVRRLPWEFGNRPVLRVESDRKILKQESYIPIVNIPERWPEFRPKCSCAPEEPDLTLEDLENYADQ